MGEDPLDDKPAPDVAEQRQQVVFAETDEDDTTGDAASTPFEADIADAAEQRRGVAVQPDNEP
jgi:hypothetical protein